MIKDGLSEGLCQLPVAGGHNGLKSGPSVLLIWRRKEKNEECG